jgi:hypothetical protein
MKRSLDRLHVFLPKFWAKKMGCKLLFPHLTPIRESSNLFYANKINCKTSSSHPFRSKYMQLILSILYAAITAVSGKLNKTGRIRLIFEQKLEKISKSDIANTCPDISISMIELTVKEMLDKGEIIKVGSGRATAYVKK